jgi:hypothetical protein
MTIIFYAIYKYFHSCSNDGHFIELMHHNTKKFAHVTNPVELRTMKKRVFVSLSYKLIVMKRILSYSAAFVFIVLSVTSCEKNCKVCAQNTYDSSNKLVTAGTDAEYCDAELIAVEAIKDVTISGMTTKWECR